MINRHQGREILVKSLFLKEFYKNSVKENREFYDMVIKEYIYEGKIKEGEVDEFSKKRFENIVKNISVIDNVLEKSAPKWPIDKIFIIDKNILRLGIYELLFEKKDVPAKVVINESIELAKTFGNKNSKKFISGVLGGLYDVIKKENEQKDSKTESE